SEGVAGALVVWVALTLVTTVTLPGASYLFLWPALLGTFALLFSFGGAGVGWRKSFFLSLLTAVPAPLLLAPAAFLLYQAITIGIAPLFMALTAFTICLMPLGPKVRLP